MSDIETRRDKQRHVLRFVLEFMWGGYLSALCLGLFALIIYVAGLLGLSPTQQITVWLIGCSVATIVWFFAFLGNFSRQSSVLTHPVVYLSWSVVPALFFIGTWVFYL